MMGILPFIFETRLSECGRGAAQRPTGTVYTGDA
jgi:hypothetical protein